MSCFKGLNLTNTFMSLLSNIRMISDGTTGQIKYATYGGDAILHLTLPVDDKWVPIQHAILTALNHAMDIGKEQEQARLRRCIDNVYCGH